ncbi:MAG: SDR family oxidoreductase [Pseudomonadota bacterium]
MASVLITGANRGIGLEFVKQYSADGWTVHACCRRPDQATELNAVSGDVHVHPVDVADSESLNACADAIAGALDVVVANAGLGGKAVGDFGEIDFAEWDNTFAVNVRGVVATAQAFAPHLKKAKGKIAGISSLMGSIEDSSGGALCYRTTKAAVNMAMSVIAAEFESHGVAAAPFHPGWVQTDMGGANAPTSAEESVSGLRQRITEMPVAAKPKFLNFAGQELPW